MPSPCWNWLRLRHFGAAMIKFSPRHLVNMKRALIIGGTRNLGPLLVSALLESGYTVTAFNRGVTPATLPAEVERLYGDRSKIGVLAGALQGREFDVIIDTTLYNGLDATRTIETLRGRTQHYIFLSTGQVYLVRVGAERPFREDSYAGQVMPEPSKDDVNEYRNWLYGYDKRAAEDALSWAWRREQFPYTALRLPMINSEADHYDRIYGYLLRLWDGGPILLPEGPGQSLQHVYGRDVVAAVMRLVTTRDGLGKAYNVGQDESVLIDELLEMLAGLAGRPLQTVRLSRKLLDKYGLLPACSPFSDSWMSALDNTLGKQELGLTYTPLRVYLEKLVAHYSAARRRDIPGYKRRGVELQLASEVGSQQQTGD